MAAFKAKGKTGATVESQADVEVKSELGKATLQGANTVVSASQTVTVSGQAIYLN